jgi:hypothetical protein
MTYAIHGLPAEGFKPLFGAADAALAAAGVTRMTVDKPVGYPCRISLEDAPVGATVLLLNYEHQPADTPFRSSHAIFVREDAGSPARYVDEIPAVLLRRPFISLRSFDATGFMIDAEVAGGETLEPAIRRLLDNPQADYLHAHFAARGCYAARIDRA